MTIQERIKVLEAKRDRSLANKSAGYQAQVVASDYQKIIDRLKSQL